MGILFAVWYNKKMKKEGKYIHYCWFGGKPLPKLARKCLESWKKYLPDYEIICWSEDNCDFEECEFVKKAYEAKYYAFVADYIRTKAMCEMGGIYFDTDMEVIKDPTPLMKKCNSFLGVEDTGKVCCGVWFEKNPHGYLATELLKKYKNMDGVDFRKRNEFSIPLLITEILEPCGFDYKKRQVQFLEHNITIFPRDYFYPYSYNRTNNLFTDNTCMVHYYDASWLPFKSRIENSLVRKYGRTRAIKIIKAYQKTHGIMRRGARIVLFPLVLHKKHAGRKGLRNEIYLRNLEKTVEDIKRNIDSPYVVLHNGGWFGVTSATNELFDYTVDCRELYTKRDIKMIADALVGNRFRQIIFSGLSEGGADLIRAIRKRDSDIIIKVFWHGNMSQVLDSYGWKMHKQVMELCKRGDILAFATCKKSLLEFYKYHGVNAFFITNTVGKSIKKEARKTSDDEVRIGLYAASPTNWRKNMFSQIAAVSLIRNASLDIVPLDEVGKSFARSLGVKVTGVSENLTREELMARMGKNDVNMYVTFSECSPMLPLESLEMGVPCITGDNHHYFTDSALERYLVVSQEDDIDAIKAKIKCCIDNRKQILEQYKLFREVNRKEARRSVREFLEVSR